MKAWAITQAAALLLLLPVFPERAWALAARFGDPVTVRGQDVVVRVEVLDDPGVVARVKVELRRPEGAWMAAEAQRAGRWWAAVFPGSEVWADEWPDSLEARAAAFGKRGGVVLEIGVDEPLEIDVLTPERAAQRARDLQRTESRLRRELEEGDVWALAGLVGTQARLADRARIRALLGLSAPLNAATTLVFRVSVGPAFSPPADLDGGVLGLGLEAGLRVRNQPPRPGRWSTFAGPRIGTELRLPGVDGFVGAEAGTHFGLSSQAALELSLVGSALLLHLVDDPEPIDLGFSGGLRVGLRLGEEEKE